MGAACTSLVAACCRPGAPRGAWRAPPRSPVPPGYLEALASSERTTLLAACTHDAARNTWTVPPSTVMHRLIYLNQQPLGFLIEPTRSGAPETLLDVPGDVVQRMLEAALLLAADAAATLAGAAAPPGVAALAVPPLPAASAASVLPAASAPAAHATVLHRGGGGDAAGGGGVDDADDADKTA